jgi:hypothetical protein
MRDARSGTAASADGVRGGERMALGLRATAATLVGLAAAMLVLLTALAIRIAARAGSTDEASERVAARRLAALSPRGVFMVVDTAGNRLRVYSRGELVREATCSTGTGIVLRDPRNSRSWVFDTPLGERRVIGKRRDPVWTKPDWAFIEEGFLPSSDPRHRFDDVSLGDYALDLGDGYLIHGTLFPSLLGRPVTHGCIRLGDEDLEYVYRTVPIGAPVYLY